MVSSINSSSSTYLLSIISPSREQRKADFFRTVDGNSNGSIDTMEFSALAKRLSERSGESLDTESLFSTYDADGNGSLSASELDAFMQASAPPPPPPPAGKGRGMQSPEQRLDDLFAKIDTDGDGGLSKTEFTVFAESVHSDSGSSIDVNSAFSTYDADGDGTLSKSELDAFMKANAPAQPSQTAGSDTVSGTDNASNEPASLLQLLNDQDFSNSLTKLLTLLKSIADSEQSASSTSAVNATA